MKAKTCVPIFFEPEELVFFPQPLIFKEAIDPDVAVFERKLISKQTTPLNILE